MFFHPLPNCTFILQLGNQRFSNWFKTGSFSQQLLFLQPSGELHADGQIKEILQNAFADSNLEYTSWIFSI
jgi:hypothetical protein